MNTVTLLNEIFLRDLNKLRNEIGSYTNSGHLWHIVPGTSNAGGNLAIHLAGNLRHFVGHILGGTSYVRNRDEEFAAKNLSIKDITERIDSCISEVSNTFEKLTDKDLSKEYPAPLGNLKGSVLQILLHLLGHFNYHLGQINYHRRYITDTYS